MLKSNKQRQREWRERQKRNNLEDYIAKELNQVQSYKSCQNQSTFFQKHCEATHHCCEGKKILQGTPANISPAKMSWQSLGKAVKHTTKALSKSPSKKKSVVCALAKSFRVMNTEKKVINSGLSACGKEAIQNFISEKTFLCICQENKMLSPWEMRMARERNKNRSWLWLWQRPIACLLEKIPQSLLGKVNLQSYDQQRCYCHQKCPTTFVAAFTTPT